MSYVGKKRKRVGYPQTVTQRARKLIRSRRYVQPMGRSVIPGYTRRAGFYGRYQGRDSEYKFFDTALSFSFDLTNEVPATGQLVLIPQGVTESTRVGRKCVIKSILLKGTINLIPGANALASGNAFQWLVLDKQTNGAAAAVTDVFTGSAAGTALRNLANSSRFQIIKKFKWQLSPMAGVTTAFNTQALHYNWFKRCNIPIEYSSTTGAITEIRSNNLFLIAGADTVDDIITQTGVCRVRFSDG